MVQRDWSRASDGELLRATRAHPDAFGVVYQRHIDVLLAYLVREAGSRDVALELVSETFARALAGAHRFKAPVDGSARPWLFGIAGNLLGTYRRRRVVEEKARRRLGILEETTFVDNDRLAVDDLFEGCAAGAQIDHALDSLPAEQRLAVQLRVAGDLSYAEIARRLGCTPGAARTRVSRGLASLRAEFREVR